MAHEVTMEFSRTSNYYLVDLNKDTIKLRVSENICHGYSKFRGRSPRCLVAGGTAEKSPTETLVEEAPKGFCYYKSVDDKTRPKLLTTRKFLIRPQS